MNRLARQAVWGLNALMCLAVTQPAQAVPIAPGADYFTPQPETASYPNEIFPSSPQPSRDEFYPSPPQAPSAAIAPTAQQALFADTFIPQAPTVMPTAQVMTAQIAPQAVTFIPQAQIAPTAQEFLP